MVDFALVPHRTALVNVDMQNCFVQGSPFAAPDGIAVQRPNQPSSRRVSRRREPRRTHPAGTSCRRFQYGAEIAPIVKQGIINSGSEFAAFHKGLVVDLRDVLLEKLRLGAFDGT